MPGVRYKTRAKTPTDWHLSSLVEVLSRRRGGSDSARIVAADAK
jgi:hypothetical protein